VCENVTMVRFQVCLCNGGCPQPRWVPRSRSETGFARAWLLAGVSWGVIRHVNVGCCGVGIVRSAYGDCFLGFSCIEASAHASCGGTGE
jgi:hypothetical protein